MYNVYTHANIFYTKDFFVVHVKGTPSSGDPLTTGSKPSPSEAVLALRRQTCHLLHADPELLLCQAAFTITPLHPNTCFGVRTPKVNYRWLLTSCGTTDSVCNLYGSQFSPVKSEQ